MDKVIKLVIAVAVLYVLLKAWQGNRGPRAYNSWENYEQQPIAVAASPPTPTVAVQSSSAPDTSIEDYAAWTADAQPETLLPADMMMPPVSVSADLLPKPTVTQPAQSTWAEFAPNQPQQSFLDATKFIGVDTQGSSLKNGSWDLRSTIVIPRKYVGPWMQSDIQPDLLRRPLE